LLAAVSFLLFHPFYSHDHAVYNLGENADGEAILSAYMLEMLKVG
jgi:hypothetical protein